MSIRALSRLRGLDELPFRQRVAAGRQYVDDVLMGDTPVYGRVVTPIDATHALVATRDGAVKRETVMFGSNNYLGLSMDRRVVQASKAMMDEFGVSLTGSNVLNGFTEKLRDLESSLAKLKGTEDCLVVNSGYLANQMWTRSLVRPTDSVIFDEFSHRSFLEGLSLSQCAHVARFQHNTVADLRQKVGAAATTGDLYVFTEGLFSMDGDVPPYREMVEMRGDGRFVLVVDDAHGTGVLGETGRGIAEDAATAGADITVGTLSKALGAVGGFICGSRDVITFLRGTAFGNIFTASLPPAIVGACLASLRILETEPERVARLRSITATARAVLGAQFDIKAGQGPIVPVFFDRNVDVKKLTFELFKEGYFVNFAIYPAVPINKSRLRISICSEHTERDIEELAHAIKRCVVRSTCV